MKTQSLKDFIFTLVPYLKNYFCSFRIHFYISIKNISQTIYEKIFDTIFMFILLMFLYSFSSYISEFSTSTSLNNISTIV